MSPMASQITGVSIVYSTVCSGADQRKHQRSASLAIVRGIQRWPVISPHKGPVTRKMFPLDDVTMIWQVSPQLSYGDTCQIWTWFDEFDIYFCNTINFYNEEIYERSFSNPHKGCSLIIWLFPLMCCSYFSLQLHWQVPGEFSAQKASNAENVFIWWRHHDKLSIWKRTPVCWNEVTVIQVMFWNRIVPKLLPESWLTKDVQDLK